MRHPIQWFIVSLFLIANLQVQAESASEIINVGNNREIIYLNHQVSCFIDSSGKASVESMASGMFSDRFQPLQQHINTFTNLGAPLWFRFRITNHTSGNLFLEIGEPSVNHFELYKQLQGGKASVKEGGYFTPYEQRDVKTNNYLLDLDLLPGDTASYFLRITMRYKETITVPLATGTLKAFTERNHRHDLLAGIFYGAVIIVTVFNWIIFFSTWDRSYLYFSIHTILAALWVAHYYGNAFEFLWGSFPEINKLTPAITAASSIFVILFSRIFLKSKDYAPKLHKGLAGLQVLFVASVILNLTNSYFLSLVLVEIGAFVMCIYLMSLAIYVYAQGYSPAKVYMLALMSFFLGIIVFLFQINGVLKPGFVTRNAVPIGLGLEIALISFAQGNRLSFYRQEKKRAQTQLIASLQENEQLLLEKTGLLETKLNQQQIIETMRGRISRDIHDDVSSGLTKISWLAESLKPTIKKAGFSNLYEVVEKIIFQSRETILKFGEIIWAVNPDHDNLESLLAYMRNHVAGFLDDRDLRYIIDFPERVPDLVLSPDVKRNLYLILKEALNNCVKYAQASVITISLKLEEDTYIFIIQDNGKGISSNGVEGTGNGMINMERRMKSIGGTMTVSSSPGMGTRLEMAGKF